MKKIITLLLALVLSLCAPICAMAATPDESDFLSRYAQEPYVVTDCQISGGQQVQCAGGNGDLSGVF